MRTEAGNKPAQKNDQNITAKLDRMKNKRNKVTSTVVNTLTFFIVMGVGSVIAGLDIVCLKCRLSEMTLFVQISFYGLVVLIFLTI